MLSQLSYSPSKGAQAIQARVGLSKDRSGRCATRMRTRCETPRACYSSRPSPEWRNWHTQGPQKAPAFGSCGFESHLRHRPREAAPREFRSGALRPNMTTEDAPWTGVRRRGEIALHKWIRALALVGFASFGLAVMAPGAALAQYRDFTGRIDKINDKKMIVDNRQGDKVTFDKLPDTKVDDTHEAKKKAWSDLKSDDWVTVKWKM